MNVATLRAGINMDAVLMAAQTIIDAAKLTADRECVGASKFVCFANMVEDSPFMAGAVHGSGEADASSTWAYPAPASWQPPSRSCPRTPI